MDRLSRIVAGMWRAAEWPYDAAGLLTFIHTCLDQGITTFDHADIYGDYTCEERFGAALALEPALRKRVQLVSKCDIKLVSERRPAHGIKHYDTGRRHILATVDASLRALHTDYLDVLLLHRPDPLMDADETAAALESLHRNGKIRACGVSNFKPSQVRLLASCLSLPLVTNQIEFSVLHLEPLDDGTLDQCQERHMPPMAWSPLAGGRLFAEDSPAARRVRAALETVGADLDASPDQVALAWLLRHPARVHPVLGTGKPERVAAAVAALDLRLSREQWFAILAASRGQDVP